MGPVHRPFAELIKEFSAKYRLAGGEQGGSQRLKTLYTLLEVPSPTAEDWFRRGIVPAAERARKLQLMFSLCGFEASERIALNPSIRTFVDTVVTVISVKDAASEIGLTANNLLLWVRGSTLPKRLEPIIQFNERYAEKRNAKVKTWKRMLQENGFAASVPVSQNRTTSESECSREVTNWKLYDEALIYQVKALSATIGASEILSDNERKKAVRQAVGHDALAELVGKLQRISMAQFNLNK